MIEKGFFCRNGTLFCEDGTVVVTFFCTFAAVLIYHSIIYTRKNLKLYYGNIL